MGLDEESCPTKTDGAARGKSVIKQGGRSSALSYKMEATLKRLLRRLKEWDRVSEASFVVTSLASSTSNYVYEVQAPSDPHKVLARIYGPTAMLFERSADIQNYHLIHSVGLAPKLLASDENGRIEGFLEDYLTLQSTHLRHPSISTGIARCLAQFHLKTTAKLIEEMKERTMPRPIDIWYRLREWWSKAKEANPALIKALDCADIEREVSRIERTVKEGIEGQFCFCHCDLQHGNIMMHRSKEDICFVDYEYACLAPMELDIANHWCEWCADYNADPSHILQSAHFPTHQQQSEFLRQYLTVLGKEQSQSSFNSGDWDLSNILLECVRDEWIEKGIPTEMMIERLRKRILLFVPLAHTVWMLWSVIQDAISNIDFNFRGHAEHRQLQIKHWIDNNLE